MEIEILTIIVVLADLAAGVLLGMFLRRKLSESKVNNAKVEAEKLLHDATKEAETIRKEATIQAKDVVLEAKADWEKEARELRREIHVHENRLLQKEENLEIREESNERTKLLLPSTPAQVHRFRRL